MAMKAHWLVSGLKANEAILFGPGNYHPWFDGQVAWKLVEDFRPLSQGANDN